MNTNLKIKKEKEYNPIAKRTIKTFKVGNVRGYLRAVKQNPKDVFGIKKASGCWYNTEGRNVTRSYSQAEQYDPTKIYFYEVGANDGSYRKCATIEEARERFAQLFKFEQRQTEIK